MNVGPIQPFAIDDEGTADEYLKDLLTKRENRSMDVVRYHAKIRNVPPGRMMDYFISKAEEISKTYSG